MPSAAARSNADPVRRLGLGTVQFGQAYGVSNTAGQVPLDEVRAMLARAAGEGVAVLDTAANYGQAEEVLAQCDTRAFRIVSKTVSVKNGVAGVIARARQSVQSLGRVDVLLVHAVADLLGPDGDALWRALRDLKEQGTVGAIGISAYVADDPAALAHAINRVLDGDFFVEPKLLLERANAFTSEKSCSRWKALLRSL